MSILYLRSEDYAPSDSWRLVEWCVARGADEFTLAFLGPPYLPDTTWAAVDMLLVPFRRRVASAGDRWILTGESAAVLREILVDGLFTGELRDASPGDPAIYRGGTPLLTVATLAGEATLDLRESDEASFTRTGMPFHRASRIR